MTNTETNSNRWRFFRAGGFDQVKLETGADLAAIDKLDLKLWVALACPTSGLEFDKTTLSLIDTDKDGRIRAPEVITALKWSTKLLKNPDDILKGPPAMPLAAVDESISEGKTIVQFARQVLGKADTDAISTYESAAAAQTFAAKPFNGDGIITAESATDNATKAVINEIVSCLGSDNDISGKPGVGLAKIDQFFADAAAYSDWWSKAEGNATILPLGLNTPAAVAAVNTVRAKVEDFFARCRLASFDPRAINALNREEKEFLAIAAKDLTISSAEIAAFPLARIEAGASLPLLNGVNPAWASSLANLFNVAVKPLLGDKPKLSEEDWNSLLSKIGPYEKWSSSKAGGSVEKIGLPRVREILAKENKETFSTLVARDKAESANAQAVAALNRLVHYHRHLGQFCHNFISFRDFYGRKQKTIFQAGTLYLDQRACDLCLTVEDPGRHAAMAGLAGTYLAYCDCARKATGEKMQIVAAFTGGDSDELMVGRNGIFFDRKGNDWDATITKIIENPISIRQAFFAPYKKLVRMIEEQIAKKAAAADAAADAKLAAAAKASVSGELPKPTDPPPKQKIDTGTLAAIGLVLTTLLGALGTIFARILGLEWWQIPLAFLAILLAISGPSMLIAYLKLRRRNLGPILDANGWAVNTRARLNVPFGGSLTSVASLPPGSQRDVFDPYAEKASPWPKLITFGLILIAILLILNQMGYINDWTHGRIGTPKAKTVVVPAAPEQAPAK